VRATAGAEYEIELFSTHPLSRQPMHVRLRGYVVRIDGVSFLNARAVAPEESDWMFFRYETTADGLLTVRALREEAFGARRGPADLREFLRQNLRRDDLYTDIARYRKAKES
jgi:hypothetical protein